jgi:hypothetical protein
MVFEDADGGATRLADVYVYGFDNLLAVVDADNVSASDRAELVAPAARDTDSIHRGTATSVQIAGNGYQLQLPGCEAAGFSEDDRTPVIPAQDLLIVHDGTQRRLAEALKTQRQTKMSIELAFCGAN